MNSTYLWLLYYLINNWCCYWCSNCDWSRSSNSFGWCWGWNRIRFLNNHNLFLWSCLNDYRFNFFDWSCLLNRSRLWSNWSLSLENWRNHDWDWNRFLTCWFNWCCNLLHLLGNLNWLLWNHLLFYNWLLNWSCLWSWNRGCYLCNDRSCNRSSSNCWSLDCNLRSTLNRSRSCNLLCHGSNVLWYLNWLCGIILLLWHFIPLKLS